MQNSMPVFDVWSHRSYMGQVAAVSLKQAKVRARAKFPHKRLQIEGPVNVPLTDKDRLESNIGANAKAIVR